MSLAHTDEDIHGAVQVFQEVAAEFEPYMVEPLDKGLRLVIKR